MIVHDHGGSWHFWLTPLFSEPPELFPVYN